MTLELRSLATSIESLRRSSKKSSIALAVYTHPCEKTTKKEKKKKSGKQTNHHRCTHSDLANLFIGLHDFLDTSLFHRHHHHHHRKEEKPSTSTLFFFFLGRGHKPRERPFCSSLTWYLFLLSIVASSRSLLSCTNRSRQTKTLVCLCGSLFLLRFWFLLFFFSFLFL